MKPEDHANDAVGFAIRYAIDSANIGSMLESVQAHRIVGPISSLFYIDWTDITGQYWRFDQLVEHSKIQQFHEAQQSFTKTTDGAGLDVTFMLQPIFTARCDDGGRICAMAYFKIDADSNVVARIKRVPIVGSVDDEFECPGGTPIEGPDVYPLPILSRA